MGYPLKASKRETLLKTRSRLRAVEDHHVDRPEVEAGQPAQLTGTNRSIGLIAAPLKKRRGGKMFRRTTSPPAPSAKTLSLTLGRPAAAHQDTSPRHITPPTHPPGTICGALG